MKTDGTVLDQMNLILGGCSLGNFSMTIIIPRMSDGPSLREWALPQVSCEAIGELSGAPD